MGDDPATVQGLGCRRCYRYQLPAQQALPLLDGMDAAACPCAAADSCCVRVCVCRETHQQLSVREGPFLQGRETAGHDVECWAAPCSVQISVLLSLPCCSGHFVRSENTNHCMPPVIPGVFLATIPEPFASGKWLLVRASPIPEVSNRRCYSARSQRLQRRRQCWAAAAASAARARCWLACCVQLNLLQVKLALTTLRRCSDCSCGCSRAMAAVASLLLLLLLCASI